MGTFNVTPIIESLEHDAACPLAPVPQAKATSEPCLPDRLPTTAFMNREAEHLAQAEVLRQMKEAFSAIPTSSPIDAQHPRRNSTTETVSTDSDTSSRNLYSSTARHDTPWKEPQPFEVLRAVEKKDIVTLMEIRDRAFHLLLRKSGDATPLLHAMRIGSSHRDVAIILLGAFSRWINNLDDTDFHKPRTKGLLKALRANLKLAIDYGLAKSQSDLTASFMQTLIMSEGDKWIRDQVHDIRLALSSGPAGKPVSAANTAVRRFATKELGKAELIAALEDYIANATVDLLIMAAWSAAATTLCSEPIPLYYFARDDRVYKAFTERLHVYEDRIRTSIGLRLRSQLKILSVILESRTTTYRRKVELLTEKLDEIGA